MPSWTRTPALILCLAFLPLPVHAADAVKRKVLVLYDRDQAQSAKENIVAVMAQMVLNYYGLLPEYRDVNEKPLPDDAFMREYRGVITTFTDSLRQDPGEYLSWMNLQAGAGRKIVVLGNPGASIAEVRDTSAETTLRAVYRSLGLIPGGEETSSGALIRYVHKDGAGVGFEREYPAIPESYEKLQPIHDGVRIYLSLRRTDRKESESTVIVTGPGGGFAKTGFIYWEDPVTYKRQWYINPFLFFKEALGIGGWPVPDPTTLNGLRVAFSHIDADGFSGFSRIDKKSTCAEMIRDRILKKYDFPVTVSVIVGEIDTGARGSAELVRLAREIFALPNVESASHTYSHPYYWDENYLHKERYEHQYGIAIPGYTFDPEMEIDYSVRYINGHLSPPGKPCRVFLWSGNCEPLETDIARCDALGVLNMNGGDTVFDDVSDSYTSVAPYYRRVGERIQTFTGQANENIMTNLWTGPFFGFRNIIETMIRTGAPRRVAPIDVYYHFFSAEYPASVKALEEVYEWVLKQDTAKMFASEYIRMVRDYEKMKIRIEGPNRYAVENYGTCLTVRFDEDNRVPDLASCRNVLGFSREPQGLYVSLAPGGSRAVIALGDAPPRPGNSFYIRRAKGRVDEFRRDGNSLTIKYHGFGKGRIDLAGTVPNTAYDVRGDAVGKEDRTVRSDGKGDLTLDSLQNGTLRISWK